MIQYQELEPNGALRGNGLSLIPVTSRHYKIAQEQVAQGEAQIIPYSPPDPNSGPEIIKQIYLLESQQTPRRLREAVLGDQDSIDFIADLESQIAVLRSQLGG